MDNLENAKIYQHKFIQGKYTLIYTTIWHNTDFELWAHVKGYGKTKFIYGGEITEEHPKNCVYAPLSNEDIEELTGEPYEN